MTPLLRSPVPPSKIMEKTDIYLSKEVHTQYSVSFWHDCSGGLGEIELTHNPCGDVILEREQGDIPHWDFMEAMSKHNPECPAGKPMRPKPSPGLYVPESEIRRE